MHKIDAIIRVAYNIDPKDLSTKDWAERFQQWVYVNQIQLKAQEAILDKSLLKITNKVFEALNKKSG